MVTAPSSPMNISPPRSPVKRIKSPNKEEEISKGKKPSEAGIGKPTTEGRYATLVATILRQVGILLDSRLATIEERLPPERSFRPPLKGDGKAAKGQGSGPKIISNVVITPAPQTKGKGGKKGGN
ncbi:gag protein [Lasius niger]|uniref:Gag protein n=1 Tax=Lasius niger TaxID=67767 RepID=A0A0J7N1E4_LASNI|nr:gag protein [Lasius niger]